MPCIYKIEMTVGGRAVPFTNILMLLKIKSLQ